MSLHDNECEGSTGICCCSYRREIAGLQRELNEVREAGLNEWQRANVAESRLAEAERLINRAVDLMTEDQVGQWEGVRAWLEGV